MARVWTLVRAISVHPRYIGGIGGRSKKEQQQKEISVDVSKYLHFCDSETLDFENLANTSHIADFVDELRRRGIGPAGQIVKLQCIIHALDFLLYRYGSIAADNTAKVTRTQLAKERATYLKKGLGREKTVMAAKKKEYVTKYLHHPRELREFLDSREVQDFVEKKADEDIQHIHVRR